MQAFISYCFYIPRIKHIVNEFPAADLKHLCLEINGTTSVFFFGSKGALSGSASCVPARSKQGGTCNKY
jgi:hypothetical protein